MRARRQWPDRNPLRRAAERAEFAVVALLLVAFAAGVPLAALATAHWAAASGLRTEQTQAGWRQVTAVLLHDASTQAGSLSFPVPWPQVPARWASPARPRTGIVDAPPGATAGSAVMVWTDRSGRLTGAPVAAALLSRVLLAALAAPVVLSVMLLVLWAYAGIFLDWRRMAAWDADWAITEPQWSRRH